MIARTKRESNVCRNEKGEVYHCDKRKKENWGSQLKMVNKNTLIAAFRVDKKSIRILVFVRGLRVIK